MASAERPNLVRPVSFEVFSIGSASGSGTESSMPTTSSSEYTGGPAIQYGDCGSRHGSTAASGFHHGEPGPGNDGSSRSPGAGAKAEPEPWKTCLSSSGTGCQAVFCRGGTRSPGAGANGTPVP